MGQRENIQLRIKDLQERLIHDAVMMNRHTMEVFELRALLQKLDSKTQNDEEARVPG